MKCKIEIADTGLRGCEWDNVHVCVCVCCACVCVVCVCVSEREREKESVYERESLCVWKWERIIIIKYV